MATQKKRGRPKKENYKAVLYDGAKEHTAEGSTIEDALGNLKLSFSPKIKVILRVSKGDNTKERVLRSSVGARLASPNLQVSGMAIKQMTQLFDV